MSYAFVQSDRFLGCVRDFQQRDPRYLAELWETVIELGRQPFGNPILQTHRMQGVSGEKRFITDVGAARAGGSSGRSSTARSCCCSSASTTWSNARASGSSWSRTRRPAASRSSSGRSSMTGRALRLPAAPPAAEPGQLFMAWTDAELAGFGFLDHEVPVLRRLDHEDELLELTMRDEAMETAVNLVAYQNPDGKAADQVPASRQREFEKQTRSVVDDQELELERKVASPRSRKHFAPTSVEALKEVMAKPIEDWMIFLHPDQAKLTQRPFSGPARVRGAAGTGKTVVALHRAKHLAETYGEKVLFTTYVTNLPKVFGQLFTRLAPELEGQVEFVNLHAWAYRFVKKHGSPFQVDTQQSYSAYNEAYKRIAGSDDPDLDGPRLALPA
jgi:hypothetical protein